MNILVPNRDKFILKKCNNKKVLHIGCTDWPYTKHRLDTDNLLYAKIDAVCSEQLGLDLDEDGAQLLNEMDFSKSHIEIKDMNTMSDLDFAPEVIVFGETLEHLLNAGVAFDNLKQAMSEDTELIISVPNAYYVRNFVYGLLGREYQHPDHSLAFTYKTLKQLTGKVGLTVSESYFSHLPPVGLNWKGKVAFWGLYPISRMSPMLASRLLFVCKR